MIASHWHALFLVTLVSGVHPATGEMVLRVTTKEGLTVDSARIREILQ